MQYHEDWHNKNNSIWAHFVVFRAVFFHSVLSPGVNDTRRGYCRAGATALIMKIPSRNPPSEWAWKIAACGIALVLLLTLCAGCAGTAKPKTGDTVRVHYTVALPGNPPFESHLNGSPLEFKLGSGRMIPGFDKAVMEMTPGQTVTVTIPADQAYGLRNESLVGVVDTEGLTKMMTRMEQYGTFQFLKVPWIEDPVMEYHGPEDQVIYYLLTNITEETTTVDQNHFLAGRDLVFTITLVEIVR